jgi:hypothetical protein
MSDQGFVQSQNEERAVKAKALAIEVTLVGSTTTAACLGFSNSPDGVTVYTEATSATAPSNANFSGLASAATPTVIGLLVNSGRIKKINRAAVDANTIFSASMTAGVVTLKGDSATLGSNRTGVTDDGNGALQVSCTGLDLNAASLNHKFTIEIDYDVE